MKILWIWNSCINDLIKSDIFWLFAIVLCEEAEEACAILQLCVENLSFRVTKQTEPKRENIQEKATKKEKENQIVVECSSKIKYPVSWGSIYWGMRSHHSSEIWFSAYLRNLHQLHSYSDCCYPLLVVLLLQGIVETWQML